MSWVRKAICSATLAVVLLTVGWYVVPLPQMQRFADTAWAQTGCVPNPNASAAPGNFVNGCGIMASALNKLTGNAFMSAVSIRANAPVAANVPSIPALCGASDSTAALQAAANYLSTVNGGDILISCPITVATPSATVSLGNNTRITGLGSIFYPGMLDQNAGGGVILATWPPTSGSAINCTGSSFPCITIAGIGDAISNLNLGNPQPAPVTQLGTLNGTTTVTGLVTSQLAVGMIASGTNIPSGSTISSIDTGSQIHISNAATGSGSVSINFFGPTVYPFVITTSASSNWSGLHLDHLTFTSASKCIELNGTPNYDTSGIAGGQWTIGDIWFNPCFNTGIRLHQIDNTGRITNLDYDFWWNRSQSAVGQYVKSNSLGFDMCYAANTFIDKVEFFANKSAVQWTNCSVITGGLTKTFAGFNMQFSNIDFNLTCQAMTIASGNATLMNGGLVNVIAAQDGTGQCGSQNAFFDLSSDNISLTMGGYVRVGQVDTLAAIGGSNAASPVGELFLDGLRVTSYSAFHTGKPLVKASANALVSFGNSIKSLLFGAGGAGTILGAGVDGSGPPAEQSLCIGGGQTGGEGSACVAGSGAGNSFSGAINFYDNSATEQAIFGQATSTGVNITPLNGSVFLKPKNGANTFTIGSASSKLILIAPSLPTNCTGQVTGTMWNNTNVVDLCP